ncbi:cytochrome b5 domain-containing protein [Candidatus Beckwithbacteria bacterium]|nr:cytochrome b5 domain-containing protein [Candidatus Beckwithbacteria bacterium]
MKKIFISFLFFSGILLTACNTSASTQNQSQPQISPTQSQTTSTPDNTTETKTYSLDEVAKHNGESDCWLVIHDKVYDVTKFIPTHPGGKAIVQGCGIDATALFDSKPAHAGKAQDLLPDYLIGSIK